MRTQVFAFGWIVLLLFLFGTFSPDSDQMICQRADSSYDGVYAMTFEREGELKALGQFQIQEGQFSGAVYNKSQDAFQISGYVLEGGELKYQKLTSISGKTLTAQGRIDENFYLAGSYELEREKGIFLGSLENQPTYNQPSKQYDGTYTLQFRREGNIKATLKAEVKNGRFAESIVNTDNQEFEVSGYILEDGTLVFQSLESKTGFQVLAQGNVDVRSKKITGIYQIETIVGVFSGYPQSASYLTN